MSCTGLHATRREGLGKESWPTRSARPWSHPENGAIITSWGRSRGDSCTASESGSTTSAPRYDAWPSPPTLPRVSPSFPSGRATPALGRSVSPSLMPAPSSGLWPRGWQRVCAESKGESSSHLNRNQRGRHGFDGYGAQTGLRHVTGCGWCDNPRRESLTASPPDHHSQGDDSCGHVRMAVGSGIAYPVSTIGPSSNLRCDRPAMPVRNALQDPPQGAATRSGTPDPAQCPPERAAREVVLSFRPAFRRWALGY